MKMAGEFTSTSRTRLFSSTFGEQTKVPHEGDFSRAAYPIQYTIPLSGYNKTCELEPEEPVVTCGLPRWVTFDILKASVKIMWKCQATESG
jgi:hypothetical protein